MGEKTCPHCNQHGLCWESDADADDCGYEMPGIVSFYHCRHCGAYIEIYVPNKKEE